MTDTMHQPRDDNGQWISISTLFERERGEHNKDHDRERLVAGETARRLEREVEETARRLERLVDETASRLEAGVAKALDSVSATALVHSEAHNREHVAHERIHSVEKAQVEKAEGVMSKRLDGMNEIRGAMADQARRAVSREVFDQRAIGVDERLNNLERVIVGREAFVAALEVRDKQIALLESFRAKALGFGALLALISGVVGSVIGRVF